MLSAIHIFANISPSLWRLKVTLNANLFVCRFPFRIGTFAYSWNFVLDKTVEILSLLFSFRWERESERGGWKCLFVFLQIFKHLVYRPSNKNIFFWKQVFINIITTSFPLFANSLNIELFSISDLIFLVELHVLFTRSHYIYLFILLFLIFVFFIT